EKQIDHIIRAYHKFLQSGYQTELHLFGRDEDNQIPLMNTLISELKLSDKVKIFKYTNQPLQEFKNSKASLLTSQYEGFGLTLMESIEMGCPVLSYNVRYGPSEIIQNGINGYLIEKNDIDSLSKHMINIIEHPLQKVKNKDTLKYNAAVNNYKQLMQILDLLK
ncbi:MAG: glycosyltransferase, partial [Staphylococcus epidermidis]|nr:glycosyltransferase [Staphylococcus epidermidis]